LPAQRSDVPRGAVAGGAGVVLSLLAHAATFVALGLVEYDDAAPDRRRPVEVTLIAEPAAQPIEAPPAPVEETKPPEPEPEKPPPKVRVPKPELAAVPPPVDKPVETSKPPAPAEETLADFSGTTLTGDSAGGWVSAVGNNAAMNGPIGKAGAAVTGRDVSGVAGGVVGAKGEGSALRVAGPNDLSRQAEQPDQDTLNAALERNYPKSARLQGIEGTSQIRLRVLASGKPEPLSTISETYPGFADACRATLRSVRFRPALDRAGQPVATDIVFPCTFSVE
jgi:periplasmic protein TonB